MMSKKQIEAIQPGQTLYEIRSYVMGNTTIRSLGVYDLRIVDVVREDDGTVRYATATRMGRPARYTPATLRKLHVTRPQLVQTVSGASRKMTREERAAIKAGTAKYLNYRVVPA